MRTWLVIAMIAFTGIYVISTGAVNNLPAANLSFIDPVICINEGQSLLKEGDLVLRMGTDPCSNIIKNFSRHEKKYSHAGIIVFDNGYPYVWHIINGTDNPGGLLRKDSLFRFCDPLQHQAFGIYRYQLASGELGNIKNLIKIWQAKAIQFDSIFNFKTDDRMYCSEMICKLLAKATGNRILIKTNKPTTAEATVFAAYMHLPVAYTSSLQIVAIDNLYMHPLCHLVKEYTFGMEK